MPGFRDLSGQRFGRLVVLERAENQYTSGGAQVTMFKCRCDCGKVVTVRSASLLIGRTRSCGCLHDEMCLARSTKHNGKHERLYKVWQGIKTRCYNPNAEFYSAYGGRGIHMCDSWKNDYAIFRDWAMANGYNPKAKTGECTLDRIDVNGNYEPDNCRWVSMKEQSINRRYRVTVNVDGKQIPLRTVAEEHNVGYDWLYYRYVTCKLPIDKIFQTNT